MTMASSVALRALGIQVVVDDSQPSEPISLACHWFIFSITEAPVMVW